MGSAVVPFEISSEDEEDVRMPAADAAGKRKSPEEAINWAEKMLVGDDFDATGEDLVDPAEMQLLLESLMDASGIVMDGKESAVGDKNAACNALGIGGDNDDDDDCVILDGDPDKPVAVAKEGPRRDAAEDELQIVAEKGELACRDFPHSRHLCATLLFSSSSHASHCKMCHCYVCDSPAPCAFWGNGATPTDHCHATDKDAKWKKLRQSSRNKSHPSPNKRRSIQNFCNSSATGPSSESSANVNGSTGRFLVSTVLGLSQNQQVDPSSMAPWRAPSPMPRATVPSYGSKSAPVATPVYTPSNASVPRHVPMQPPRPNAFQAVQVPPRGRVSNGTFRSYSQLRSGAAIGFQPAPNTVVGTRVPLSRYTSVATQGTKYQHVPSPDARFKEKEAIASLARELGVADYCTSQPLSQQSVNTLQYLQSSQLLAHGAQAKASQQVQGKKIYGQATSQMRPSSGHNLSYHVPGSTVLSSGSVQIQQPLCQLNSQSSLALSGTDPSTLLGGK